MPTDALKRALARASRRGAWTSPRVASRSTRRRAHRTEALGNAPCIRRTPASIGVPSSGVEFGREQQRSAAFSRVTGGINARSMRSPWRRRSMLRRARPSERIWRTRPSICPARRLHEFGYVERRSAPCQRGPRPERSSAPNVVVCSDRRCRPSPSSTFAQPCEARFGGALPCWSTNGNFA